MLSQQPFSGHCFSRPPSPGEARRGTEEASTGKTPDKSRRELLPREHDPTDKSGSLVSVIGGTAEEPTSKHSLVQPRDTTAASGSASTSPHHSLAAPHSLVSPGSKPQAFKPGDKTQIEEDIVKPSSLDNADVQDQKFADLQAENAAMHAQLVHLMNKIEAPSTTALPDNRGSIPATPIQETIPKLQDRAAQPDNRGSISAASSSSALALSPGDPSVLPRGAVGEPMAKEPKWNNIVRNARDRLIASETVQNDNPDRLTEVSSARREFLPREHDPTAEAPPANSHPPGLQPSDREMTANLRRVLSERSSNTISSILSSGDQGYTRFSLRSTVSTPCEPSKRPETTPQRATSTFNSTNDNRYSNQAAPAIAPATTMVSRVDTSHVQYSKSKESNYVEFKPFPKAGKTFEAWKDSFRESVAATSNAPNEAFKWIL